MKTLLTGVAMGESPRWHDNRLWFCDWGTQEIIAVGLDSEREVMARVPSRLPFCIDWLPDGRLLVVSGPENRVLVRRADGALETYADLGHVSRGGWNEIVIDGRGNSYVNGGAFDPSGNVVPGVIALVTTGGQARRVADDIQFPNGMILTQDGRTLIVAESHGKRLTAFDVDADGGLSNRRIWADVGEGAPDGICLDAEGAVWYADVPNKRCVRVREGGEVLATVEADQGCFACALGGEDGRTLFVLTAEWRGFEKMAEVIAERTGRVLMADAPAPAAGTRYA